MEDAVERRNGDEREGGAGAREGRGAARVTGRRQRGSMQVHRDVVDAVHQMLQDRVNVAERRATLHEERQLPVEVRSERDGPDESVGDE